MLLGLSAVVQLAANFAQYLHAGPSLFGGCPVCFMACSGIVGFSSAWRPARLSLPPGVLVMMLAWLLICMTGIFELLQFGAIANAAHVGGLLAGCLTGLLGGTLARRQRT